MNSILDLLWLRVPPIRYVSPPACIFEASGSGSSGPIIVIDVHPRLKVTGLRIENCVLIWDDLPVDCQGSCPTVSCYNVYRAEVGSETYQVFAECVDATQLEISDNACYRVSAITSEGETDLSDPVCSQCACGEGEAQTPVELIWVPASGSTFSMTTGDFGLFAMQALPGQTKGFETQASICNQNRSGACLKITVDYDLNIDAENNQAQFDIWSDSTPLGTFRLFSSGPTSTIGGIFVATLPLLFGSNVIFMRARAQAFSEGLVNFVGNITVELTNCS